MVIYRQKSLLNELHARKNKVSWKQLNSMIGLNLHFFARLTLAAIIQISYELLKIIFLVGEWGPFRGTDGD